MKEITNDMILKEALRFLGDCDFDVPCDTMNWSWCDDYCQDDEGPHEMCWREYFKRKIEKDLKAHEHEDIIIRLQIAEKDCLHAAEGKIKLNKQDLTSIASAVNEARNYIEECNKKC